MQQFTAIGQVTDETPYQPKTSAAFKPYRRNVHFLKVKYAAIRPMLDGLGFIKNKTRWGFYLMSGFRQIEKADFERIRAEMT